MNQVQTEQWIQEVHKKPIPVLFCDSTKEEYKFLSDYPAWTSPKGELLINEPVWSNLQELDQYWIILHELGHLKDKTDYHSSSVSREFCAQRWALNKSKFLKVKDLHKYIKKVFQMWEYVYEWNSDHRRYILASKLAKQKRII